MIRRTLRVAAGALATWLVATVGIVVALRWLDPSVSMVMLLEPGRIADVEHWWIGRAQMPIAAAHAVIAAEDQKFLDHFGFDLSELGAAIKDYRRGDGLRGASTISQQVAKNLFLWNGRSFARKAVEAYFALLIEICWTKERILEVYLNLAEFGPSVFGVAAASDRLLGVPVKDMTPYDAALLAAVLPNPKRLSAQRPSAYVRSRQVEIVTQMGLLEQRGHYVSLAW